MTRIASLFAGAALALATITTANAMPLDTAPATSDDLASMTVLVSGGCGPYAWRGPYGHCRDTPFYGRLPNGAYKLPPAYRVNVCPPGYWVGPYGHCRNTPFHGRLPNGTWT